MLQQSTMITVTHVAWILGIIGPLRLPVQLALYVIHLIRNKKTPWI